MDEDVSAIAHGLTVLKARRRIKRFIKTGEHVARVHPVGNDGQTFEYKEKHHVKSIFFKKDTWGRLRVVNQEPNLPV